MPEGWCRNYTDALQTCKKRFGPDKPVGTEGPHGRDYFGGDLAGITQKLRYLKSLGVTVIYLNPIFSAGSNHRYDTRDYTKVDRYLGTQKDFVKLVKSAHRNGIKVLLDGVFNHMSSDSPIFDRYHNWRGTGACEQTFSQYRGFFFFRKPAAGEPSPCAPKDPAKDSFYDSWFGFDSLPKLTEVFGVKQYVFDTPKSAAQKLAEARRRRLAPRRDAGQVVDFWHGFRAAVEKTKPNAPIVGELWKKFDVLPYVNGDTADSSMDYRFRDAVVSLLAPHAFDSKGFPGSGQPIPPSQFVNRMESIREDYPDAVYWTLMNLVDSHDTERILWTLSPGDENRAQRELNPANLAEGKQRAKLAALIQMTMPGAPTIYYGDEVGVSGDDDPTTGARTRGATPTRASSGTSASRTPRCAPTTSRSRRCARTTPCSGTVSSSSSSPAIRWEACSPTAARSATRRPWWSSIRPRGHSRAFTFRSRDTCRTGRRSTTVRPSRTARS